MFGKSRSGAICCTFCLACLHSLQAIWETFPGTLRRLCDSVVLLLSTVLDPPREGADTAGVAPLLTFGFSSPALAESAACWLAGARVRWPDMSSRSEVGHKHTRVDCWEHREGSARLQYRSSRCRPVIRSVAGTLRLRHGRSRQIRVDSLYAPEPQEAWRRLNPGSRVFERRS